MATTKEIKGMTVIIDGNYVLNKLVHSLAKSTADATLEDTLLKTVKNLKRKYSSAKVVFVSDKGSSWRKDVYAPYKATRKDKKHKIEIDWAAVYETYEAFKQTLGDINVKLFESNRIEGDDWITFLLEKENNNSKSCLVIATDGDLKQRIQYEASSNRCYMNMMTPAFGNITGDTPLFLPSGYKSFLYEIENSGNEKEILSIDDLFGNGDDLGGMNDIYLRDLQTLIYTADTIKEVDADSELFCKIIKGDKSSDNIPQVMEGIFGDTEPKKRGIGEKTAIIIYEEFLKESTFDSNSMNEEFFEELTYLIIENRSLDKKYKEAITTNIKRNNTLINLRNLPKSVSNRMDEVYKEIYGN